MKENSLYLSFSGVFLATTSIGWLWSHPRRLRIERIVGNFVMTIASTNPRGKPNKERGVCFF